MGKRCQTFKHYLAELYAVLFCNLTNLVGSKVFGCSAGRTASLSEEAIEPSRSHDPQHQQIIASGFKSMPSISRYEYRGASGNGMRHFIQKTLAIAFYHIKGFLHVHMPMNRNAAPRFDLLRP